jgi:hypothetical protein
MERCRRNKWIRRGQHGTFGDYVSEISVITWGNDSVGFNMGDVEYKYLQGFDGKHILTGYGALPAE